MAISSNFNKEKKKEMTQLEHTSKSVSNLFHVQYGYDTPNEVFVLPSQRTSISS